MKVSELPSEIQTRLSEERLLLAGKTINTPYEIRLYNAEGTRYFAAVRRQMAWADDKGHSMPFGGGSEWKLYYGAVQAIAYRTPVGTTDYELRDGKRYDRSANGTIIPSAVATKKEAVAIAKSIGLFNI